MIVKCGQGNALSSFWEPKTRFSCPRFTMIFENHREMPTGKCTFPNFGNRSQHFGNHVFCRQGPHQSPNNGSQNFGNGSQILGTVPQFRERFPKFGERFPNLGNGSQIFGKTSKTVFFKNAKNTLENELGNLAYSTNCDQSVTKFATKLSRNCHEIWQPKLILGGLKS